MSLRLPDRGRATALLALSLVLAPPTSIPASAAAAEPEVVETTGEEPGDAEAAEPADEADAPDARHAHEHAHDEHDVTETIIVTASPLEHGLDELAVPVVRIERTELLQNLGSTLGETLSRVPGLTTTGFSAGASRPVVRGQDAYRTEVLEDGLRTQDVSQESADHALPVNPLAARRVEVIRGPSTIRYGGGASAGVVNVITQRVPDRLPDHAVAGEVFGGLGLVANQHDIAGLLDGRFGNVAWHADGVLRQSNNYAIPNDSNPHTQVGSQTDAYMGSLGAAYIGDLGRLGFAYIRAEDRYGIPETAEPVEIDMKTDRYRFEGDLDPNVPGIREVRVRGVYSNYEHSEIASDVVTQTWRNEQFDGRLEVVHEPIAGFAGAFGLDARHRDFRAEGVASEFLAPAETVMAAGYLFEERELASHLTAEIGFRAEHTSVQGRDVNGIRHDVDFVPISGSAALLYEPTGWLGIGLTGSVSQRAPTQVELFARGAHDASATYEIGDPDLDVENAFTGELRATATAGRGRLEGAVFATRYQDYIFGSLTGQFVDAGGNPVAPDDPIALKELLYVHRDALFYGSELSGNYDLIRLHFGQIGIDGRFDVVRARFTDGSEGNLPRIVPIRWGSGLYFQSESFDARVGFLRHEAQNRTDEFTTSTSSFTFVDASLAYRFEPVEGIRLEANVTGRNLNDVRGRNAVAFNKEDILLPGRSIRFGLQARF